MEAAEEVVRRYRSGEYGAIVRRKGLPTLLSNEAVRADIERLVGAALSSSGGSAIWTAPTDGEENLSLYPGD